MNGRKGHWTKRDYRPPLSASFSPLSSSSPTAYEHGDRNSLRARRGHEPPFQKLAGQHICGDDPSLGNSGRSEGWGWEGYGMMERG